MSAPLDARRDRRRRPREDGGFIHHDNLGARSDHGRERCHAHGGEQGRYADRSVRVLGGDAFVAGHAKYTSDFQFPDQLHMHVVRSPHADATMRRVDLSGATKVAGVVLAMDGQDAVKHFDGEPP